MPRKNCVSVTTHGDVRTYSRPLFILVLPAFFVVSATVAVAAVIKPPLPDSCDMTVEKRDGTKIGRSDVIPNITVLNPGDKIINNPSSEECNVTILDNNTEHQVGKGESYTVGGDSLPPSVIDNMKAIIVRWTTNFKTLVGALKSGNEKIHDLEMPLLGKQQDAPAMVVASDKLYLAWNGGKEPYHLSITAGGRLIWESSIPSSEAKTGEVPAWKKIDPQNIYQVEVPVGKEIDHGSIYQVKVTDDNDHGVTGYFKVVTAEQSILSKEVEEKIQKEASQRKNPAAIWYAIWLATQKGEWKLEAYQKVAGESDQNNDSVKAIIHALAHGWSVNVK